MQHAPAMGAPRRRAALQAAQAGTAVAPAAEEAARSPVLPLEVVVAQRQPPHSEARSLRAARRAARARLHRRRLSGTCVSCCGSDTPPCGGRGLVARHHFACVRARASSATGSNSARALPASAYAGGTARPGRVTPARVGLLCAHIAMHSVTCRRPTAGCKGGLPRCTHPSRALAGHTVALASRNPTRRGRLRGSGTVHRQHLSPHKKTHTRGQRAQCRRTYFGQRCACARAASRVAQPRPDGVREAACTRPRRNSPRQQRAVAVRARRGSLSGVRVRGCSAPRATHLSCASAGAAARHSRACVRGGCCIRPSEPRCCTPRARVLSDTCGRQRRRGS
jgi:hypothetical protein